MTARVPPVPPASLPIPGSRVFACGALACATLLLFAWLAGNAWLDAVAVLLLGGLLLHSRLRRGEAGAWLAWIGAGAALLWLARRGEGQLALDSVPVIVNAALCGVFACSLAHGREPLIARVIEALEGRPRLELPGVAAYARVLTRAWAWLLGVQALVLACVVVLRQPGGLLATFGVASPFALSGAVWSAWLHAGSWLLVPVALVLEYAVRRLRLRHIPHASLAHFLIGLARNWPAVLRGLVYETPPLR